LNRLAWEDARPGEGTRAAARNPFTSSRCPTTSTRPSLRRPSVSEASYGGHLSGSRVYARSAQVGGVPPPARRL